MERKNHLFEKEHYLPNLHLWISMLIFTGVHCRIAHLTAGAYPSDPSIIGAWPEQGHLSGTGANPWGFKSILNAWKENGTFVHDLKNLNKIFSYVFLLPQIPMGLTATDGRLESFPPWCSTPTTWRPKWQKCEVRCVAQTGWRVDALMSSPWVICVDVLLSSIFVFFQFFSSLFTALKTSSFHFSFVRWSSSWRRSCAWALRLATWAWIQMSWGRIASWQSTSWCHCSRRTGTTCLGCGFWFPQTRLKVG